MVCPKDAICRVLKSGYLYATYDKHIFNTPASQTDKSLTAETNDACIELCDKTEKCLVSSFSFKKCNLKEDTPWDEEKLATDMKIDSLWITNWKMVGGYNEIKPGDFQI